MPIATASSAYVLEDRASPTVRAIKEEAKRATVALRGMATAVDKIGTPTQTQRLERFEGRIRSVATTAESMSGRVQRTVGHMEGAIRRDTLKAEARLMSLEGRMDDLGRRSASPRVELDGYVLMRAQIASLDRALDSLARRHASPNVGASIAGAAGGGGGAVGRSGAFVGTGGAGMFTSRGGLLAGAALTALPAVSALTGTVLPLAGSLTGATLGGAGAGLAGGGALVAGIGALTAVAKPAMTAVKDLRKEQEHYNEVVAQYGKGSTQAKEAQRLLNVQIARAPAGARNLSRELDALLSRWQRLSAPGQSDLLGLGAGAAHRLRSASPFLAAQANDAARATRREGTNLAGFLTSPGQLIVIRDLTRSFSSNLDEAEGTLENVLGTVGNLARASTPFFHEGMVFLEHWTSGWEHSTRDITQTRQTMGGYVQDLKAVGRLGGAGFDLVRDLVMPGRQQGTSVLADATMQLREWDDWAKRNPDRIRRFYRDSIEGTKSLVGLAGTLVHDLHELADVLLPVLSRFAQLGQLAGGAGLLLPTAIRLGLGRAMGGGGGRASGAVSAPIGAATAGTAGAGAGAAVLATGAAAGYPTYRTMRANAEAARAGARTNWTGWTGVQPPAAGRFAGARGRVIGGAQAAGRFAAPIALVSAALDASATQGSFAERAQGAASGLTFGLLPMPVTGAQAREQGQARAIGDIDRLGTPRTAAGYASQIALLQRRRQHAAARSQVSGGGGLLGGRGTLGLFDAGYGGDAGPTETEARRNAAAADKYAEAIRNLRAEQSAYRRENDRRSGVASELHGGQLADSFQQGFATLRRHEGPERALTETLDGAMERMRKMRPEGAKVLGESMLAWARTIAHGNPRLQGIVQDMTTSIERRFSRMGKRVQVVNGQILTGSRDEWRQISDALGTPAERAQERVSKAFTAIQREALGSLRAMGYSSSEAHGIVTGAQRFGADSVTATGARGRAGRRSDVVGPVGGVGTGDGIGDGPGTRSAARPIGGALMGANPALTGYATQGARFGLHVSSGRRPGAITTSGNVSLHASGDAIDESGPAGGMLAYARYMANSQGSGLDELIHTPLGYGIKNGRRVPLSFWGAAINAQHMDHVHVGDRTPGGAGGALGGSMGGVATTPFGGAVRLTRRRSGVRGVSGRIADSAIAGYTTGLEQRINGAGNAGVAGLGGDVSGNRALARSMMLRYGGGKWGPDQWPPLNSLWTRESNFNENAVNAQSGAGGIPQALPSSKMGPGWQGNPRQQIGWGLGYIDHRYHSPAAAWGHSQATGWYGRGGSGRATRPTLIGVGDAPGGRSEDFAVRPSRLGPPSSRSGRHGGVSGLATVTIQTMNVHWARDGDLTTAVKDELRKAFEELTAELDEGVHADEDALLR